MKYKSCHLLEQGLFFDKDNISVCCLLPNPNSHAIKLIDNYNGEKIDWDTLFDYRKKLRDFHKSGQILPTCESCYNLEELDWGDENSIRNIYFSHWTHCNCKCYYCPFETDRKIHNKFKPYKIMPILKEMKEKNILGTGGYISLIGGEPTILKEFDDILKFFYSIELKTIVVNSSGIKYSKTLAKGIEAGKIELTISIDCSDKILYKKIKQVNAFDTVVKNITKYVSMQKEPKDMVRLKFIILPGINDSIEEVEKWLQLCKKIGLKKVILDIETEWFLVNVNNIPEHINKIIDYAQTRAKKMDFILEYYSHVNQILCNRNKN